jgi:glycosyltransferase involved in cell wall biosynthesis
MDGADCDVHGLAPRLSIVIPAYNVAAYIGAAVQSALDQDFRDLEVIVVDDGSTDSTPQVLAELVRQRSDPRLRILRQENAGLSGARNAGIAAARAAFIGFLDGDDIWLPSKAGRHMEAMRAPDIGISFSHSVYLREDGVPTGGQLRAEKACPTLHDMIRRNHVGNGSAAVVRRVCIDAAGLFRTDLRACEDYELWCRILHRTPYRAQLVDAPLTLYRQRLASLSYDHDKFVAQADAAMRCLRAAMPIVPKWIFDAGQAEHYRIAAWKAAMTGGDAAARHLLVRAVRRRPVLLLTDRRAAAMALWLTLPALLRRRLIRALPLRHSMPIGKKAR